MRLRSVFAAVFVLLFALYAGLGSDKSDSSAVIKRLFANPPREYSTVPLWIWNDMLTDDMVMNTLRDLAGQGIKQVFVHPRPGLMTPYLSEEWFRLWKLALKEGERLGMNLWIYDENSYPSGFAGGLVPDAMPESRGRGLGFSESEQAPAWKEGMIAVYRVTQDGYQNVTDALRAGESMPSGRYVAASVLRARNSAWNAGRSYVDLLYPGVTRKFLDITLEAYRREIGAQFGKRVPGSFTDEPQLRSAGNLPWTEDLPQQFEKRWGYRITDHLPALREQAGDWQKVRHNYYQLLLELFIERWAKPYYEYCSKNGLEFTGHYWEHEWPNTINVPDNMALAAWQHRPGIDTLMNRYDEGAHGQFGNVRAAKEITSVANQLGRARTLSEIYGAGGWDLRFEDMKRIGDWLEVLGVNTLDQHLSYISIRGARKRDHPQSFSYVEPWWDAYHASASYLARISLALSRGKQVNQVLVLEPTTSVWMYNSGGRKPPELERNGEAFQKLVVALEKAQVEYDLGCEDVMARHGSVSGNLLHIGQRAYRTVVIPPFTENLNARTMQLLEAFAQGGGSILSCSPAPDRVDGAVSALPASLEKAAGWKRVEPEAVPAQLSTGSGDSFAIRRNEGDKGVLFHHRRRLDDGQMLFLVNSSMESSSSGAVESGAQGVERWDPMTGKISPYTFVRSGQGSRFTFDLPPSGSLLLFLSNAKRPSAPAVGPAISAVPATGSTQIRRAGPNVLILDYVDVTAGGESRKDSYVYQASQFAFQKNGMARNPWDNAVQFKDEIISKRFPPDSGFVATYRFVIGEKVPSRLFLAVERPDLYQILCNGKPVNPIKGEWWLDRAFGKLDIAAAAKVGANEITLKAAPFKVFHELEAAYILGDFALQTADTGFVVVPEKELQLGTWNAQGYPFYSTGLVYSREFRVDRPSGTWLVAVPAWYGSVAKVSVNGKEAGAIISAPWQADVTGHIRAGVNTIEVTVVGTLKNTLGPHHGKPALGAAWPADFQKGPSPGPPPGLEYSTVGYGLMKPFELIRSGR